jgi:hypothetical protein
MSAAATHADLADATSDEAITRVDECDAREGYRPAVARATDERPRGQER